MEHLRRSWRFQAIRLWKSYQYDLPHSLWTGYPNGVIGLEQRKIKDTFTPKALDSAGVLVGRLQRTLSGIFPLQGSPETFYRSCSYGFEYAGSDETPTLLVDEEPDQGRRAEYTLRAGGHSIGTVMAQIDPADPSQGFADMLAIDQPVRGCLNSYGVLAASSDARYILFGDGNTLWDSQSNSRQTLPANVYGLAVNTSRQVIGDNHTVDTEGHATGGFYLEGNTRKAMQDIIPAKYRKQLRSVIPYFISNPDTAGNVLILVRADSLETTTSGADWKPKNFLLNWKSGAISEIESIESQEGTSFDPVMITPKGEIAGKMPAPGGPVPVLALATQFAPLTKERVNWGFDRWLRGDKRWDGQGAGWTENIDLPQKETWLSVSRGGAFYRNEAAVIVFGSQTTADKCELYIPPASQAFIELVPTAALSAFTHIKIEGKPSLENRIETGELWVLPKGRKNKQPAPTAKDCIDRLKVMAMPARTIPIGIWRAQGLPADIPGDADIVARLNESYRQACIAFVLDAANSGALLPGDWDANGDNIYDYNTEQTKLGTCPKLTAQMNLVVLPKASILANGQKVTGKVAALFNDSFRTAHQNINDLPFTCAHEVGHLLGVSTRNSPERPIGNGERDDGKQHDGTGEIDSDRGMYPSYVWTLDTGQLLLNRHVASPGYYTDEITDRNYDVASENAEERGELSIMRPGGGQRRWLRHEDWRRANENAIAFE